MTDTLARRELFKKIAASAVAAGAISPARITTVDAAPAPAFAVFEFKGLLTNEQRSYVAQTWERHSEGTAFESTKALVLDDRATLTFIAADGRVLNERVGE